jgi:glycosyltransferase involved in cell wall biosynthesis
MLLDNEFPPDERVQKEIKSLLSIGISVDIACVTQTGKPLQEIFDGYTIFRKPISKFIYKSQAAILILPFYFWFWDSFINKLCKTNKYDCIHVHDLPLSKVAYKHAKKNKLKLICDQHEYYSDWIVNTAHYNTLPGKIIKFFSNWIKYEKKYLEKADCIITVEEPLKKCYVTQRNIDSNKIIVTSNTPAQSTFNNAQIDATILEKYKDKQVILYAGNIDILRGLDVVIKSLPLIEKQISNILFVIVGKVVGNYDPMQTAKNVKAEHLMDMVGWVSLKTLPSYIAASKICVCTPPATRFDVNNSIATKIYQYVGMGKPTIVSSAKMMKNFVESNKVGYSVEDNDFEKLSELIITILNSPSLQNELGNNCKILAQKYVWEETSKDFINYYKSIKN